MKKARNRVRNTLLPVAMRALEQVRGGDGIMATGDPPPKQPPPAG